MAERAGTRFWSVVAVVALIILIALVVAFASGYINWPWQASGEGSHPPASTAADSPGVEHYAGDGFSFDYPASWHIISDYQHFGLHGPTVVVALGTGDFDLGCVVTAPRGSGDGGSVSCSGQPGWTVSPDEVVVAYHVRPWLGPIAPQPTPSLGPGQHWATIDHTPVIASQAAASMTWQFPGAPAFIEARFGSEVAAQARADVEALIASWRWESGGPVY